MANDALTRRRWILASELWAAARAKALALEQGHGLTHGEVFRAILLSADPASPWRLVSVLWAEAKARATGGSTIGIFRTIGPHAWRPSGEWEITKRVAEFPVSKIQVPAAGRFSGYHRLASAILAAWVSLCPLAPQQAKREAVIAADPVHAPVELVSRLRAAKSAIDWHGPLKAQR